MKAIRYIACAFLSCVYLGASCLAISTMAVPVASIAGPAAIAMHSGNTSDIPIPSLTQRRHVPPVKPVSVTLESVTVAGYASGIGEECGIVHLHCCGFSVAGTCSCIHGRAPPLSCA